MSSGLLSLTYSMTVNSSSFQFNHITLAVNPTAKSPQVHLTSGILESTYGPVVYVQLSNNDLNSIKLVNSLCVYTNNCLMRMNATAVKSIAEIGSLAITTANQISATDIFPDIIPPQLLGFTLNMNISQVWITFNEPVQTLSVFLTDFNLTSDAYYRNAVTFTSGAHLYIQNGIVQKFSFSSTDSNAIEVIPALANSVNDSFLSSNAPQVLDMYGNQPSFFSPVQATSYVADHRPPIALVISYYDALTGILKITFSKPVNSSTLSPTSLLMQSKLNNSAVSYQLSSQSTVSLSPILTQQVQITLSQADLLQIKLRSGLFQSASSSFISFNSSSVLDKAGNGVIGRPSTLALGMDQTSTYISSDISPSVIRFGLDMNQGLLNLTFSDVVSVNTLSIPTNIGFQLSYGLPNNTFFQYYLTGGYSPSQDGFSILIFLSHHDMNEIKKRTPLATSLMTTYMILASEALKGVNGLPILSIVTSAALQASFYQENLQPPQLYSFSLDLNAGPGPHKPVQVV